MTSQGPSDETAGSAESAVYSATSPSGSLAPQAELSARQADQPEVPLADGAAAAPAASSIAIEAAAPAKRRPPLIRQYELVDRVLAYDPHADEALLNKAYIFAMQAHGDQKRSSGDPYFSHPLAVAGILTELKLDTATIATALLHDVVEDTEVTIDDIQAQFGAEIARLVDGVTKISVRELAPDADGKAENFAKFLLATAKDVRVLLVKLADRMHNMRTLDFLRPDKRERISKETMEIYAPMAARIGVQSMREELEDLSFRHINPKAFETITEGLEHLTETAAHDVVAFGQELRKYLAEAGVKAEVYSREKRAFSVWRKMQRKRATFEELADIYAFRVIVTNAEECYTALGTIHRHFRMIPHEFDDYISTPKPNGYQSIHTAVLSTGGRSEGQRVEIQIRSKRMHDIAERGVAAHWRYKDKANRTDGDSSIEIETGSDYGPYEWLRHVLEGLVSGEDKSAFLDQAKIDLYQDQIFPFTPKGRVVPLPSGATPLDFAYAVHTAIGDQYFGAKVNGVRKPHRTVLKNGDIVEVIKSKDAPIPTGWETLVNTGAAKSGIKRRIRELKRQQLETLGERMIVAQYAARKLNFSERALENALPRLGVATLSELYQAAARMQIPPEQVVAAIFPDLDREAPETSSRALRGGEVLPRKTISLDGVTPGGVFTLASCCSPLKGERIVGVRDHDADTIRVHRIDCDVLAEQMDEEWLNLSWSEELNAPFIAKIHLTVNNRTGALGHLATMLARYGADITDLSLSNREEHFTDLCFDITVRDTRHLASVLTGLRASDYVVSAERRDD